MSELGLLSDRYQRISEGLIRFNEAIMFLKDVYLGQIGYERKAIGLRMDTIASLLKQVLPEQPQESESESSVPESAIIAVRKVVQGDLFLHSSVKNIYQTLTDDRFKKELTNDDFIVLDTIAGVLSENASQAFRRIWRHR